MASSREVALLRTMVVNLAGVIADVRASVIVLMNADVRWAEPQDRDQAWKDITDSISKFDVYLATIKELDEVLANDK